MTEGLAHPDGSASAELERLYGVWSDGGAGILLSGNIQVDADHLERPGNVIVDGPLSGEAMNSLKAMAAAGPAMVTICGRKSVMPVVRPKRLLTRHPKHPRRFDSNCHRASSVSQWR